MPMRGGLTSLLLWSSVVFAQGEEVVDMGDFLDRGTPWRQKSSVFMRSVNQPNTVRSFDWVAQDDHTEARYPKWQNSPEVTLWGDKMWECLAHFDNDLLTQLKISIYNKGDVEASQGPSALLRGQERIVALLRTTNDRLKEWTRDNGRDVPDRVMGANNVSIRGRQFLRGDETLVSLEWGYSGNSPERLLLEYVTLVFEPLTRDNDPRIPRLTQRSTVKDPSRPTAKGLAANVTRTVQGDVYIEEFPMVDQGAKGYCAVATIERILRYYGQDVDQHVLAQLAESSGRKGTTIEALYKALHSAGSRLGVTVRDLQGVEPTIANWRKCANDYNRQARLERKPEIEDDQWIERSNQVVIYRLGDLMEAFDWNVYTNYKLKREPGEFKRFCKYVKDNIDSGVPLVWSVLLGKVEEPHLPQAGGAHMRTIIGYNEANGEIIYSDSWGPGHEFKKMSETNAYAITLHLDLVAPRLRR
jgi:hypothetical protein